MHSAGPFDHFHIASFDLHIQSTTTLLLPRYKGSAFRGAFGWAFRRVVCCRPKTAKELISAAASELGRPTSECRGCIVESGCPYALIFEPGPGPQADRLRNLEQIPRPFVLEPPLDARAEYPAGSRLTFRFLLFGRAIAYFPYFLVSVQEMGRGGVGRTRGQFSLLNATDALSGDALYDGASRPVVRNPAYLTGKDLASQARSLFEGCGGAVVMFTTPARLKYDRHLHEKPDFHVLIRSLLRRASTISYFYHGDPLDLDFRGLIEAARRVRLVADRTFWDDWERYSSRQKSAMRMGGLVGEVLYDGIGPGQVPPELLELLCLGQYTHVGKGATFGLGKYDLAGWSSTGTGSERPAAEGDRARASVSPHL